MTLSLRHILTSLTAILVTFGLSAAVRTNLGKPDLEAIRTATLNESSPRYYPKLLKEFMANDTTMTDEDFQYFYYGSLFQEDYDPYRPQANPDQAARLAPLFNKKEWSRAERKQILDFAIETLADNPVNLRQLTNRIFVYEQNGKYDLAKIWQYKLNHLLLVIASSGTGADPENAWQVVYPQDEYDFLNLSGITVREAKFQQPYYDYVVVNPRNASAPEGYYFNISEILRQYYLKHPSEL
ncbi:MAG: DUF4919 domain-containing protein [Muribaculaceae bacterium]|nr:DUF4919 domain-containing protein [Muribaculaceae bacterium]